MSYYSEISYIDDEESEGKQNMTTTKKKVNSKVKSSTIVDPAGVDIKSLVSEVLNSSGAQYRLCPFSKLDGQVKQFIDAMVLAENEGNRKVPRSKFRETLRRTFNLHVSETVILRHLRKDCPTCHPVNL